MSQPYSLAVQAALGNRFARILLAAELYRAEKRASREARELAQLNRAHRWRTHEALTCDRTDEEGARQEGGREEARDQEGQGPGPSSEA